MSDSPFEPFEQSLRARWYSQPALSLDEAKSRWGEGPFPWIIRYRVLSFFGKGERDYRVSTVRHSLYEARRYCAHLRELGIGRSPAYRHIKLKIRRTRISAGHVLLKVNIPVLMKYYEPPHVVPLIALLYSPLGRVKAYCKDGQRYSFPSIRHLLDRYHRDVAWLARCEAFHLAGE